MSNLPADHQVMLATWQQHAHAEFVLKDADAALATMTENPHVILIPSGTGGNGWASVHASMRMNSCRISRRISNSVIFLRSSASVGLSTRWSVVLRTRSVWIG